MAQYHLILFLVGASGLMTVINLMEAKPVPAARTPSRLSSSSFADFHRSLLSSMDDMFAIPGKMAMPSFVYYQIISSIHGPFRRAKCSAMKDSSEESDEEEELEEDMEESEEMEGEEDEDDEPGAKKVKTSTAKSSIKDERSHTKERENLDQAEPKKEVEKSEKEEEMIDKDSEIERMKDRKVAEPEVKKDNGEKNSTGMVLGVKEASQSAKKESLKEEESKRKESLTSEAESQVNRKEEEEEESVTAKSEQERNSEKEPEPQEEIKNQQEESVTEEFKNHSEKEEETVTTETLATELPGQELTLTLITETTTASRTESIVERMLPATPRIVGYDSVKNVGSPSITYVCKYGKCQHSAEAKKLLEQEIEAELWAKL